MTVIVLPWMGMPAWLAACWTAWLLTLLLCTIWSSWTKTLSTFGLGVVFCALVV